MRGHRHPGLKRDRLQKQQQQPSQQPSQPKAPEPKPFQANFATSDGGLGDNAAVMVPIGGVAVSAEVGDAYVEPTFDELLALARKHVGWNEQWFPVQLKEQNRLYNEQLGAIEKRWSAQQRVDRFFDPSQYPLKSTGAPASTSDDSDEFYRAPDGTWRWRDPGNNTSYGPAGGPDGDPRSFEAIRNHKARILASRGQTYKPGFSVDAPWPGLDDPIAQEFERLWTMPLPPEGDIERPFSVRQMFAWYLCEAETVWYQTHIAAIEQKWFGGDRQKKLEWEHYASYGAPDANLQRQRFNESRAGLR